jgi:putative serine/threonine protein kinase
MINYPVTVPVEELKHDPYSSILCYPRVSKPELESRIAELIGLGIEALEFFGKSRAFNIPVLGKGYVGIVTAAHMKGERVALKIRRVDADRQSLGHESEMLAKANAVQVGPKIFSHSRDFLVMELVEGDFLPVWFSTHKDIDDMRRILTDILEQTWRLDQIGLDHGELSKAPKHIVIDENQRPRIFDFETASDARKPANVTAACQYLFVGSSPVAAWVGQALGERDRLAMTQVLKLYKRERTRENFERIMEFCLRY